MKTFLISGWAQPIDTLAQAFPNGSSVDYLNYAGCADYFKAITPFAKEIETVVGWSLGGQIAIRAIAEGVIKPKKLILIATPYQFVSSDDYPFGMPVENFAEFRASFIANPGKTLARFSIQLGKGDNLAKEIIETLIAQTYSERPHTLAWLDQLRDFSCRSIDFSAFPPTIIVQGEGDTITPFSQAAAFAAKLPKVHAEVWKFCGHVPQLHDAERLRQLADTVFA